MGRVIQLTENVYGNILGMTMNQTITTRKKIDELVGWRNRHTSANLVGTSCMVKRKRNSRRYLRKTSSINLGLSTEEINGALCCVVQIHTPTNFE